MFEQRHDFFGGRGRVRGSGVFFLGGGGVALFVLVGKMV
jgi:hypothetical protein